MKSCRRIIIAISLIVVSLSACQTTVPEVETTKFEEPDPETYVSIMPSLWEYFHLRKQAVMSGDTNEFFKRYPDLEFNINIESGINTESIFISDMHALSPVDGNVNPEY